MKRRNFLQLTTAAALGTPFLLNGTVTQAMNNFLDAPINCANINDRVLVIVRLAGANDGLNTVIPISQYDTYANLRPDIRIQNTGVNSFISLDNTLKDNRLSGLHPSLTGFKSLYDSGKLSVINGVGYPIPNFSHFKTENTMFAGKDGTNNDLLNSGMFGRYLNTMFPNLAGSPTTADPDPLALQLGNSNPSLFYGHSHENGIEYNMSNFQESLFNNLQKGLNVSQKSEYQELLAYITQVESAMDTYYDRIQTVFNAGINSSSSYPDTDLGKQLKTVARMIQGGSKTKIFQVNLGGFDTHVNQVESDSAHLGRHATLISDISNSITAFQNDIEALGIDDKIMTVTFSEFGRQVRQNANLGTDHGTLSPFFVVGSSAEAGVYGAHPNFSNSTSFQYKESQRRYDYRQLFATLMQDWLGADDVIMQETALNEFSTQEQKIPLISAVANAYPSCLVSPLECEDTITAVKELDDNGWSYYRQETIDGSNYADTPGINFNNNYLFAIEHTPTGIDANTNSFTATVTLTKQCDTYPMNVHKKIALSKGEGMFALGYFWNIQLTSGSTNGCVNIRWFTDSSLEQDLNTVAQEFQTNSGATYLSEILHLSTTSPLALPDAIKNEGTGLEVNFNPLLNKATGNYLGYEYIQYNQVDAINNSGGGQFIKATKLNQDAFMVNPENYKGAIRYNPENDKIEGFDGTKWHAFH
jgi:uncharacterized protein (DUF1501 family)